MSVTEAVNLIKERKEVNLNKKTILKVTLNFLLGVLCHYILFVMI